MAKREMRLPLIFSDWGYTSYLDGAEGCCSVREQEGPSMAYFSHSEDGRLFAAAPDMLKALQSIPLPDCGHSYPHLHACWVCLVRQAITKAERK